LGEADGGAERAENGAELELAQGVDRLAFGGHAQSPEQIPEPVTRPAAA